MTEIIYKNNLQKDVEEMKSQGVGVIVNLLSLYDLKYIGVALAEYESICEEMGIELVSFPIQSMKGPSESVEDFDQKLIGKSSGDNSKANLKKKSTK